MKTIQFSRRLFLASSSAAVLSACVTCGEELPDIPADLTEHISDAHTHFFNATDLPVAGYIKYVFIREFLRDLPGIALAVIDIFVNFVKQFAVTIAQERAANLSQLTANEFDEGVSVSKFSEGLKAYIEDNMPLQVKAFGGLDPENNQDDSYQFLASILNAYESPEAFRGLNVDLAGGPFRPKVSQQLLAAIATGDERRSERYSQVNLDAENKQGLYGQGVFSNDDNENGKSGIANLIDVLSWAFLMMKSRCYHVNQYISKMSAPGLRPSLVVNLLVDYDEWLNDVPLKSSSHLDQIKFWHDYSSQIEDKLDIRTFAGYDPLKHAHEKEQEVTPHFDQMIELYNAGKLSGFKIYPPMGFRAIGNAGQKFSASDGIKNTVVNKWSQTYPNAELGGALDSALADFYDVCVGNNSYGRPIPILTHGGNSNAPASGFGERANPKYWLDLISTQKYSKLRLCIGHFTDGADFITAMENHNCRTSTISSLWALQATAKMIALGAEGKADVYADIGYMPELLPRNGNVSPFAVSFFEALFKYCECYDPKCERLMYGSDWIMLGMQNNHENYVSVIARAMNLTKWGLAENAEMKRNFLTNNLRRFLYLDPI